MHRLKGRRSRQAALKLGARDGPAVHSVKVLEALPNGNAVLSTMAAQVLDRDTIQLGAGWAKYPTHLDDGVVEVFEIRLQMALLP